MELYHMPTRIVFGKGAVSQYGNLIGNLGKKALIVTGKHSSKVNGSLKDCIAVLESLGIQYEVFDRVEENPSLETIEIGAAFGRDHSVDFIIGIGGGSPMDAAKAIGVFIMNSALDRQAILSTKGLDALPVVAVATTSGTGSEVTPYAIVTDHEVSTKRNLGQMVFPKIAYLDPCYTMQMSWTNTMNTAIDALSHLVEGYLNSNATPWSDGIAEEGFRCFSKAYPVLLSGRVSDEKEMAFRTELMRASTYGGMVIAQTGTSLPHGMGYALTYHKGLAHGLANGVFYPSYLKAFKDRTKINRMIRIFGYDDLEGFLESFIPLVRSGIKLSETEAKSFAVDMASNAAKLKNHPEEADEGLLYEMYKSIE